MAQTLQSAPWTVLVAGFCFLLAATLPVLILPGDIMWLRLGLALVLSAVFASSILARNPWGRALIWALCAWQIFDHFIMGFHVEHWLEHVARALDAAVVILLTLPRSSAWFRTAWRPR